MLISQDLLIRRVQTTAAMNHLKSVFGKVSVK